MSFTSVFTPPAQPSTPFWGITAMYAVPYFADRGAYKAASGVDPDTYDQTKKSKSWQLTEEPTNQPGCVLDGQGNVTFTTYDQTGAVVTFTMPIAEAMAINLPGVHSYPAWSPAPNVPGTNVGVQYLSLFADAVTAAQSLGLDATAVFDNSNGPPFPTVYGPGEARKVYAIRWAPNGPQGSLNSGWVLATMYSEGVGSPGAWTQLDTQSPVWVTQVPLAASMPAPNPYWPIPCRVMAGNEKWLPNGPLSMAIFNTDKLPAQQTGTTGGGLTATQDATLVRIDANLIKLMIAERVS